MQVTSTLNQGDNFTFIMAKREMEGLGDGKVCELENSKAATLLFD